MQKKADEFLYDNEGRRCGVERRTFSYTCYIPERRTGNERRSGQDRRMSQRLKQAPHMLEGCQAEEHKGDTP